MNIEPLGLSVECHSSYSGEETPRRFRLRTRRVDVAEILDRWLAPDHGYFKVRGSDGGVYILRHDEVFEYWELTLYDSGRCAETRLSST
jgi:hypothetical protein